MLAVDQVRVLSQEQQPAARRDRKRRIAFLSDRGFVEHFDIDTAQPAFTEDDGRFSEHDCAFLNTAVALAYARARYKRLDRELYRWYMRRATELWAKEKSLSAMVEALSDPL